MSLISNLFFIKELRFNFRKVGGSSPCWTTLPNSLEELVGEYLHEIPVEPLTGKTMEYHPNGDDFAADGKVSIYGHKAGCPYLVLAGQFCDLQFLPEYHK